MIGYTPRAAIEQRIRHNHNRSRVVECGALLLFSFMTGGPAFYYADSHQWDEQGTSLLLSGVIMGSLVIWFAARKMLGASPIVGEEEYIQERVDEAIAAIRDRASTN